MPVEKSTLPRRLTGRARAAARRILPSFRLVLSGRLVQSHRCGPVRESRWAARVRPFDDNIRFPGGQISRSHAPRGNARPDALRRACQSAPVRWSARCTAVLTFQWKFGRELLSNDNGLYIDLELNDLRGRILLEKRG
jgi:hypothetical protein